MTKESSMASLLNEDETPATTLAQTAKTTPGAPKIHSGEKAVSVPDYRSKKIKRDEQLMASIGLSRKFCPPITNRTAAVYQMFNYKGKKDNRLDGRDSFIDPFPFILHPTYSFIDNEEPDLTRRHKTISYYDGSETVYIEDKVTGQQRPQAVPKLGTPELIGGQAVVNIKNNYSNYVWWELHPRNASNKWRDVTKEPIFERVDIRYGSPHLQNIREDFILEAQKYVMTLKTDELLNLAAGLTNPTVATNVDPQQLKLVLRIRAKERPEEILFTKHNKAQGSVRLAMVHALEMGVVTWVGERECYYFEDETNQPLYRVPIDNDPFESLCQYLASNDPDAQEYYKMITDSLDFWY